VSDTYTIDDHGFKHKGILQTELFVNQTGTHISENRVDDTRSALRRCRADLDAVCGTKMMNDCQKCATLPLNEAKLNQRGNCDGPEDTRKACKLVPTSGVTYQFDKKSAKILFVHTHVKSVTCNAADLAPCKSVAQLGKKCTKCMLGQPNNHTQCLDEQVQRLCWAAAPIDGSPSLDQIRFAFQQAVKAGAPKRKSSDDDADDDGQTAKDGDDDDQNATPPIATYHMRAENVP
jgi:hypothetical protein